MDSVFTMAKVREIQAELEEELLESSGVVSVYGQVFGKTGNAYLEAGVVKNTAEVREAIKRIVRDCPYVISEESSIESAIHPKRPFC